MNSCFLKTFGRKNSLNKGESFNSYKTVCKQLGFVLHGTFRSYVVNYKVGEEKNKFFYSQNGFVVTYKSFVEQVPCEYHTQALTDSQIIWIGLDDLLSLYQQSHQWERFGRLLAQRAFIVAIDRVERFLLQTPEERYLALQEEHPNIFDNIPLYHISSYLGIQGPSLSRIRKRLATK